MPQTKHKKKQQKERALPWTANRLKEIARRYTKLQDHQLMDEYLNKLVFQLHPPPPPPHSGGPFQAVLGRRSTLPFHPQRCRPQAMGPNLAAKERLHHHRCQRLR
eukprot:8945611-Pyramimonas_sp.AAC.1